MNARERTLETLSSLLDKQRSEAQARLARARAEHTRCREQWQIARARWLAHCARTQQVVDSTTQAHAAYMLAQGERCIQGRRQQATSLREAERRCRMALEDAGTALQRARDEAGRTLAREQLVRRRRERTREQDHASPRD